MSYIGDLKTNQVFGGAGTGGGVTLSNGLMVSDGSLYGYNTVLDVDFRSVGNLTLSTTGPYTIGGVSGWNIRGTGRSSPTTTTGLGLQFYPAGANGSSTDWYGSNYTLTRATLPLSNLPGVSDVDVRLRIWVDCSGSSWSPYGNLAFGISDQTFNSSIVWGSRVVRGYNNGNHLIGAGLERAGVEVSTPQSGQPDSALSNLFVFEVDSMLPRRSLLQKSFSYNSDSWPDMDSLILVNEAFEDAQIDNPILVDRTLSSWYLVLGGFWYSTASATNNSVVTFKRVRIDVLP